MLMAVCLCFVCLLFRTPVNGEGRLLQYQQRQSESNDAPSLKYRKDAGNSVGGSLNLKLTSFD